MSVACVLVDGEHRVAVEFNSALYEPSLKWARFHGLNPNRIPAGSEIIRDADRRRRIVFDEYVFDGDDLRVVDDEPVVVRRAEQGEAPPLPFPQVAP